MLVKTVLSVKNVYVWLGIYRLLFGQLDTEMNSMWNHGFLENLQCISFGNSLVFWSFFCICPQVVEEYNNRQKRIGELIKEEASKGTAVATHQEEIEKIRGDWLEPLQALIERINTNFSYYFQQINCAGEVDLKVPENAVWCLSSAL